MNVDIRLLSVNHERGQRRRCPECAVWEGQLHKQWCSQEPCPACGTEQLLTCMDQGCYAEEPPVDSERYPFIHYPRVCLRCGQINPDIFTVPDDTWKEYVETGVQQGHLCLICFLYVVELSKVSDMERELGAWKK